MSKMFGDIRQLAFVVNNIDDAMKHWAQTLGIGPFFIKREIQFETFVYQGKATQSPCVSIALANSGFLQIELIQQHDDTPSIYNEKGAGAAGGIHHVSAWVTTAEFNRKRTESLAQGYVIAQECKIASSGVNLIYFRTEHAEAPFLFEIADLMEPTQYERVMGIKNAYETWNREDIQVEVKK